MNHELVSNTNIIGPQPDVYGLGNDINNLAVALNTSIPLDHVFANRGLTRRRFGQLAGAALVLAACGELPATSTPQPQSPAKSTEAPKSPQATAAPTKSAKSAGIKPATSEPILSSQSEKVELESANGETLWASLFASYLAYLQKPTSYNLSNPKEVDMSKWPQQQVDFSGKKQSVDEIIQQIKKDQAKNPKFPILPLKRMDEPLGCEEVYATLWWKMIHHMVSIIGGERGIIVIPEGYDSSMHGPLAFPGIGRDGTTTSARQFMDVPDAVRFLEDNCKNYVVVEWEPDGVKIRQLVPEGVPSNPADDVFKRKLLEFAKKSAVPLFVVAIVGGAILILQPEIGGPALLLAVAIP